ncbi:MAG: AAA family ATPase [Candidatus Thiodiazotropha sp.]
MYESLYGFDETPFRLCADEKFCFAHSSFEKTSNCLTGALERGEGMVLLSGPPGSGKTILCRDVISRLDPGKFVVINIMMSQLSAEELLRKLALELGLPAEEFNLATLLSSIHHCLNGLQRTGKRLIIFLDEAHCYRSNSLTELKLLSNLQQRHRSMLQMVLIGNPELRESVAGADMAYIRQSVSAVCDLDSMSAEQTEGYIKHRLEKVGWKSDPFIERPVYSVVYDITQGVPRLINHIMSRLLSFAAIENKHQINIDDVLLVTQLLIEEDRLKLHFNETIFSLKERYKLTKQIQSVSSPHSQFGTAQAVKPRSGHMVGLPLKHDDSSAVEDLSIVDNEVGREYEECEPSSGDWDLPDTEWLEWDNHGPISTPNQVLPQADQSSCDASEAEFGRKSMQEGLVTNSAVGEHKWCGVWWMSDNNERKMQVSAVVTDKLPSITIDGCPDMFSERTPAWNSHRREGIGRNGIKRTMHLGLIVVSVVLVFLFMFRLATG